MKKIFLLPVVFCFLTMPARAQYDLLLKGAHVIDPKNNINQPMDLAIADGKVAAVAANLEASRARKTIDLKGLYLTPGLVDLHTHLFNTPGLAGAWAGDSSVSADAFSFRTGVTTMVDAGSAGWRNFENFRHTVIDRARTRVLALINIVGFGMVNDFVEQDKNDMKPEEVARLAQKHKDIVVGVKSAHYQKAD